MRSVKTVLLSVYDHFNGFEQRDGGRGALSRTSEATGEQTYTVAYDKVGTFNAST